MSVTPFHDHNVIKVSMNYTTTRVKPFKENFDNDSDAGEDSSSSKSKRIENDHPRGWSVGHALKSVFRSIYFFNIFPVTFAAVAAGVVMWLIVQSFALHAIDGMIVIMEDYQIKLIKQDIDAFFTEKEGLAMTMALLMGNGLTPYLTSPSEANVTQANKFVWTMMHSMSDIYILNVMVNSTTAVGYSYQGTESSWSWFGRWDYDNVTGGYWQARRWYSGLVDATTGVVDYENPPTWSSYPAHQGTLWPGVYNSSFDSGGNPMKPYYFPSTPSKPEVNNYFPEQGLTITFIYPFFDPISRTGSLVGCSFSSLVMIEFMRKLELNGGIAYVSDPNGYLVALSLPTLPIYGPYNMSSLVAQNTSVVLPYGQFNYSNYPDDVVRASGEALAKQYGSYFMASEVVGATFSLRGTLYEVSASSYSTYGLSLRIVSVIPQSRFTGYVERAKRDISIVGPLALAALVAAEGLVVYFAVARRLVKKTNRLTQFVSKDTNNRLSIYYMYQPKVRESGIKGVLSARSTKSEASSTERIAVGKNNESKDWFAFLTPMQMEHLFASTDEVMSVSTRLASYAPRLLVSTMKDDDMITKKGSKKCRVSSVFTDIEGFSSKSSLFPEEIVLNVYDEYMDIMQYKIEVTHGGSILAWIGDGLLCVWNKPVPVEDHELRAVEAVFGCIKGLEEKNRRWKEEYSFPEVKTRFGIHTGENFVGNFGGENRKNYTSIGKNTNATARLEAINKRYDTYVLCSEFVYEKVKHVFLCKLMEKIRPSGYEGEGGIMKVYEIVKYIKDATINEIKDAETFTDIGEDFIKASCVDDIVMVKNKLIRYLRDFHDEFVSETERNPVVINTPSRVIMERMNDIIAANSLPPDWKGATSLAKY